MLGKRMFSKRSQNRLYPITWLWSSMITATLLFFTLVFIATNYYTQMTHLHKEFVKQGIATSKSLNKQFNKKIDQQQAVTNYLAQDKDLLSPLAAGSEQLVLDWIGKLHMADDKQIFFIQSVANSKIYSMGHSLGRMQEILRPMSSPTSFSIHKTPHGRYLITVSTALRYNRNLIGTLGTIFSFDEMLEHALPHSSGYSILIKESTGYYDVSSGRKMSEPFSSLERALETSHFKHCSTRNASLFHSAAQSCIYTYQQTG